MKMPLVNISFENLQRLFKGERVTVRMPAPPPQLGKPKRHLSQPPTVPEFLLTMNSVSIAQLTELAAYAVERDSLKAPAPAQTQTHKPRRR